MMRSPFNIEKIKLSTWDKHLLMGLKHDPSLFYGPGTWVSLHAFPFTTIKFGLYFLKLILIDKY
jgi:hypothetical protein